MDCSTLSQILVEISPSVFFLSTLYLVKSVFLTPFNLFPPPYPLLLSLNNLPTHTLSLTTPHAASLLKAQFSFCQSYSWRRTFIFCQTLPLICTLYCWVLSTGASCTIFCVFVMTRTGMEPQSPWPLANTLLIRPIARFTQFKWQTISLDP